MSGTTRALVLTYHAIDAGSGAATRRARTCSRSTSTCLARGTVRPCSRCRSSPAALRADELPDARRRDHLRRRLAERRGARSADARRVRLRGPRCLRRGRTSAAQATGRRSLRPRPGLPLLDGRSCASSPARLGGRLARPLRHRPLAEPRSRPTPRTSWPDRVSSSSRSWPGRWPSRSRMARSRAAPCRRPPTAGYEVACTTRLAHVHGGERPAVRCRGWTRTTCVAPARLRAAVRGGLGAYLSARGAAARARRLLVPDHRGPQ